MRSKRSLTKEGTASARFFAILLAAGSGSRVGTEVPKTLLPLGKENHLFLWSLRTLLDSGSFQKVLLAVPKEHHNVFQAAVDDICPEVAQQVELYVGGQTRRDSVSRGLQKLHNAGDIEPESYIAIHDSARPFLSDMLLQKLLGLVVSKRAVTAALPIVDSLKEVDGDKRIVGTVDRQKIWAMQTPQVFSAPLIFKAHQDGDTAVTDDTALVERHTTVSVVEGDALNFKVTTIADYDYACFLADKSPPGA